MGIGFSFTAAAEDRESFMQALGQVAQRFKYEVWDDVQTARIGFCRFGDLFLSIEAVREGGSQILITGECQTNLAGAGFHAAAVDFVDTLVEAAGLKLEMDDETEYWEHRDFNRMRREHHYQWLDTLVELCLEKSCEEDTEGFRICWSLDQYLPRDIKGTLVTPFGRFHLKKLAARVQQEGIEVFAREFFLWNEREQDSLFFRNSALSMLWEDCCFVSGARNKEEAALNGAILDLLERAAALDPAQPFPKAEYQLLCRLEGRAPIDVNGLPDYQADYPIGYRRDAVIWMVGNLAVSLPGSFRLEYDSSSGHDDHIWYDGNEEDWHSLRMTAFSMDREATFSEGIFQGLFPEDFEIGEGRCRAAWAGRIQSEDADEEYEQVVAQAISDHQITLITLSYDHPEGREWAFSLLHGLCARPRDDER